MVIKREKVVRSEPDYMGGRGGDADVEGSCIDLGFMQASEDITRKDNLFL